MQRIMFPYIGAQMTALVPLNSNEERKDMWQWNNGRPGQMIYDRGVTLARRPPAKQRPCESDHWSLKVPPGVKIWQRSSLFAYFFQDLS